MNTRRKRVLIGIAGVLGVILALAAVGIAFLPRWLRGSVERAAREATGRELTIGGPFELALSLTPTLTAGDVTLANASWGSKPYLFRAGRLEITVELSSLWAGPVRVRELAIDDVRVFLERDRDGKANWAFDVKPPPIPPPASATRLPITFEHATIRELTLVYRKSGDKPETIAGIDGLDARVDPTTGMIDVKGGGRFNDAPWDVAGRLGSLDRIVEGHDVDQALTGHIGQTAFSLTGRIRDPLTLGGPNVEVSVDGPDVAAALARLGFPTRLVGPFRVHGVLSPVGGDVGFDLSAVAGDVTARARGTVGALLDPSRLDATIESAGPDFAVLGSWLGARGLPRHPFNIAGRVRRDGPRVSCEGVKVRVGGTSVVLDGTLGAPPRCVGADLRVLASGSNLDELSALTGLRLPAVAFAARGRFLRRADALAIDGVEARVGDASIHAAGALGEPPGFKSLDLIADASGPDASMLSGIARVELPPEPFEVRGRVSRGGRALELAGVAGRLGGLSFDLSGDVVPVGGLVGTDARVQLSGDDLAQAAFFTGVSGLPAEPFHIGGRVIVSPDGYELEHVTSRVGPLLAAIDGRVGAPSPKEGTRLTCRLRGPAVSDLAAWGIETTLPKDPFAVAGVLLIDGGVYRVEGATAEWGANRLEGGGTLGALPDSSALDVDVKAAGPSLAALVRSFTKAEADRAERIPAEPYAVSGRVTRVPSGFSIQEVTASVGTVAVHAAGTIATGDRLLGSEVTLEAEAPDASVLSRLIGKPIPDQAVRARGRVVRVEHGFQLDGTSVTLGPSYAEASGTLGEPPRFDHTDLEVSVEGPDLAATLGPLSGLAPLPSESFAFAAHVAGSDESLGADRLSARLGNTDVEGSLSVRFGERPFAELDLRAKQIDVARLIEGFTREPGTGQETVAPAPKPRGKKDRLIPDQPLSLGPLRAVDGHLRLAAEAVTFPGVPLRDVAIDGDLRDGGVDIHRFEGTGRHGGRAIASLTLEPEGDGYRVRTQGQLTESRLVLSKPGESLESAPSLTVEYEVNGVGKSLHGLAASADGWALLTVGPGRIPNTLGAFATSDVLLALADALNPFRKSSPYTALECGVAAADITAGKVVAKPLATRTDKLTVVGSGKLDLDTEAIDLVWTLKPRRGIGISGGSIANPYIKLGGTLASPKLDLKPLEAAASTGAAVATAGLTLLVRGIYDRITAEKKVCPRALAEARKQIDAKKAGVGESGSSAK